MTVVRKSPKQPRRSKAPSEAKLDEMIEEAIVDAYGESEQALGLFTLLEDNLAVPFETELLGVQVIVEQIKLTEDERVVAVCTRGKAKQRVQILDLPLPSPPPAGADWIMAYRRWTTGRR
jgi:hypothetical protein